MVQGTTNPADCCHLANDTDLLTPVLWAMAGDNKKNDLWPADPFTRIDPKFNHVVPWVTPHLPWKFHANRSIRFLIMLLTKKQRNKQRNRPKTIPRLPTGCGVTRCVVRPAAWWLPMGGSEPRSFFCRLWTEVHLIKFTCAGVSVVCNAVFRLTMSWIVAIRRYSRSSRVSRSCGKSRGNFDGFGP